MREKRIDSMRVLRLAELTLSHCLPHENTAHFPRLAGASTSQSSSARADLGPIGKVVAEAVGFGVS